TVARVANGSPFTSRSCDPSAWYSARSSSGAHPPSQQGANQIHANAAAPSAVRAAAVQAAILRIPAVSAIRLLVMAPLPPGCAVPNQGSPPAAGPAAVPAAPDGPAATAWDPPSGRRARTPVPGHWTRGSSPAADRPRTGTP